MEQKQIQLASGVDLLVVPTDRFKTGLFSVTLTVPLRKEKATAYALLTDVLYRGSRLHPDIASLSAVTDELYGAALEVGVRQRGESQCICAQCSMVDDRYTLDGSAVLEPAVALVGEILLDPLLEDGVFCRDYVESEGENLADRIRSRVNDKTGWAVYRLLSEMCAGEAFGLDKLGDAEEALRLTPEVLWCHYRRLMEEAGVLFYYSGSACADRVERAVRQAFGPLLTHRTAACGCEVLPEPVGAVRRVTDRMDVTQGKLAMGFRTGGVTAADPRYPALLVFNVLYGGSGISRLFLNVREKLGLCYFVSSMLDQLKGILLVVSGVECSRFDAAEEEILAQLDAVRAGDITREELNSAIRAVVSGLISRRDSQSQMEDDAVTGKIGLGAVPDQAKLIRAVERVTADQVAEAARLIRLDMVYRLTGKGEE